MFNVDFGFVRTLPGATLEQAKARITAALKNEGFGVLTEIDMQTTLKKKLDVDIRPYVILGVCNPQLAHKALSIEPGVGLLLPCNVVVAQNDRGSADIAILKPEAMFALLKLPGLDELVRDATARLTRALAAA